MYMQKLLSYVRAAVADYDMIQAGDRIAVGLSGGKDSLTLLCALAELRRFYPHAFDLEAVSVDMGWPGADFSALAALCKSLDVRFTVVPTKIKEIVFDIRREKNPCSLCSNLRRGALHGAARELAVPYLTTTLIDTIVCMEKTEIIGAYLAHELLQEGTSVVNSGSEIHVVTPMYNQGNLIFRDSMIEWISNKSVLLLVASISSGRTVEGTLDCLSYYGGKLAGISTLFLASSVAVKQKIHTLFTSEDIPEYKLFTPGECEMCKAGLKLDAIVNSEGYTKI